MSKPTHIKQITKLVLQVSRLKAELSAARAELKECHGTIQMQAHQLADARAHIQFLSKQCTKRKSKQMTDAQIIAAVHQSLLKRISSKAAAKQRIISQSSTKLTCVG